MADDKVFETHDLSLAAFISLTPNVVMTTRRHASKKRTYFVFSADAVDFKVLRESFLSGQATVSARAYADAIRSMKMIACEGTD